MEIGVKYLPVVFIFLVIVLAIITFYNELNSPSNLDGSQISIVSAEKCVLRQVLNMLWLIASLMVYIKHRQVNDILNRYDMQHRKILNRSTLQTGLLAALGSSIMANFQHEDLFYVYCVGVVLLFGLGAVYQCIQTVQYWKLTNIIGQRKITKLRMILSTISVISFVIFFICMMVAYLQRKKGNYRSENEYEDQNKFYKTSVVCECICAISSAIYFILFSFEFRKITLYEPDVFVEDKYTPSGNGHHVNEAFDDK